MLDLKWLSHNLDLVREKTALRGTDVDFERLDELLDARKDVIHQFETSRHEQREAQQQMKSLDKKGDAFQAMRQRLRDMSAAVKALDEERKRVEAEVDDLLLTIPNIVHDSVPVGETDADNEEIRTVGSPPSFETTPADHADLAEGLGLIDFESAAKVAGARFAFLFGAAARLSRVLIEFMLELHTREHGYLEVLPPFLVNRASMIGTGQLPKFEADAFRTDDYFLVPTAEVPVTNLHRETILDEAHLPLTYAAYSPCFRREAGSYGQDTRGLIRQHQFEKVELVRFAHPDRSYEELELLVGHAERVLQLLELPYRVVNLCTGDLTFSAAKCYDLEVWIPSQGTYREISSCSNFEAFQARRAGIRFRPEGGGRPEFVHTLNGSGLAIGRTIVAVLENYQCPDGTVRVPAILRERMGTDRIEALGTGS